MSATDQKTSGNLARPSVDSDQERLEAVYRALPMAQGTVVLLSGVIVVVLLGRVDAVALFTWWGASNLVAMLRWLSAPAYFRSAGSAQESRRWYLLAVTGSWVSAAFWGAMPWWIWPEDPLLQAMMLILDAGIVAGAVTTLSPLLWAAIPFVGLAMAPLAGRYLFSLETEFSNLIGLIVLIFGVLSSVSAWRVNSLVRSSVAATKGLRQAEWDLEREAFFDPLTNLPNRRYFLNRLQQEFSRAKRHQHTGALFFLDLDNFKTINDSLGHHVGDRLLCAVAQRLLQRFRDEDVAARLGGDEFVVLLAEVADDPVSCLYEVDTVASQLRELLGEPYRVDGHDLQVTTSIGVALFPQEVDSHHDLLKHADTAMYRAKAQGRNNYQFFMPDMQEEATRRLVVERELREAIQTDQLRLYYQPQVDSRQRVTGLEALVRWEHPERGLLLPGEFVPIADESVLVHDLHAWVLQRACSDLNRLLESYGVESCPTVSINVPAQAFHHARFEGELLQTVEQTGIPAGLLCLEITETSVMERVESVIGKMLSLRQRGILFSVDDFGTGYSSLAYLKRLPVDTLKIDRTFVGQLGSDPSDAAIVEAILAMAARLALKVVAEGVEDGETAAFLRDRGCDFYQGWFFGRAQPLEEIFTLLDHGLADPPGGS